MPLYAWSAHLFSNCCEAFGSFVCLHGVTEEKLKLDEAFVRISTGLETIDRILKCNINGVDFCFRVEEFSCLDNGLESLQEGGAVLETSSEPSGWGVGDDVESI